MDERFREVVVRTKELGKTVVEALDHTQRLINEGQFEQSVYMFEEAMKGYAQIELAIKPSAPAELIVHFDQIVKVANQVVAAFSDQAFEKVKEIMQLSMIPAFKRLDAGISEVYQEYLTH
ncbi:hypothetical protein [Jeotgalibacillus sp. JSM ZJ347]|uniref:hypothetical protein n=1 Tax=Jeotgalibacillus sp. JSM ZJ347 TaxID=3342117 RepID=UPI0035A94921